MDNILHDSICKKYDISKSEIKSYGLDIPIFMEVILNNGLVFKIDLVAEYDAEYIYSLVEKTLDHYYLMENRKNKLKQLKDNVSQNNKGK